METENTTPSSGAKRLRLTSHARARHLACWKGSGLSAAAYAQLHGLRATNLYAWASKANGAKAEPSPFIPVRIGPGKTAGTGPARIILRSGGFECVIEGAEDASAFASLAGTLKREVFDV